MKWLIFLLFFMSLQANAGYCQDSFNGIFNNLKNTFKKDISKQNNLKKQDLEPEIEIFVQRSYSGKIKIVIGDLADITLPSDARIKIKKNSWQQIKVSGDLDILIPESESIEGHHEYIVEKSKHGIVVKNKDAIILLPSSHSKSQSSNIKNGTGNIFWSNWTDNRLHKKYKKHTSRRQKKKSRQKSHSHGYIDIPE